MTRSGRRWREQDGALVTEAVLLYPLLLITMLLITMLAVVHLTLFLWARWLRSRRCRPELER